MWDAVLIICAYLLGSIPHLALLAKTGHISIGDDHHIDLWQKGGRGLGLSGVILDIVKGIIPVLAARWLGMSIVTVAAAGVAAAVGQMWPVFSRFNGEKGNSIGVGISVALAIKPFLIAVIAFAVGAGIKTLPQIWQKHQTLKQWTMLGGPQSNCLPVAMITGFFLQPIASWLFHEETAVTIGLAVLFALILVRRITAGLTVDIKAKAKLGSVILNRILLDRSYR